MGLPPPDPAKLRAGDSETTEVFRRILRAHVCSYFRRDSQVHDVTHDAMLELLAKLEAGADPSEPVFWALTSANNAVRRELTRLRRRAIEFESQLHGSGDPGDPATLLDAREDLRRINELLADCEDGPYRALTGAIEGRDHKEIGSALGVSPGAARMTLARARAQLGERFNAQLKITKLVALAKQAGLLDREQGS